METSSHASIPSNLQPYCALPIKSLNVSAKIWISHQLNPEKSTFSSSQYLQDWRGVAEVLGFSPNQIENFQRYKDPMDEVIRNLPLLNPQCTVGDLLTSLVTCGRFDILDDDTLEGFLVKLSKQVAVLHQPLGDYMEQDPQIDSQSDLDNHLTVYEAQMGQREVFDAYVCFAEADAAFVDQMRCILEDRCGLKLCIPDRDLLLGLYRQESVAQLIKDRCTKMIAVLSREYVRSEECQFFTNLASSLEPGVRGRKLVPVVIGECSVPNILLPLSMIDFTRSGVVDWVWRRLANSLRPNSLRNSDLNRNLPALTQPRPYPLPPPIHPTPHPHHSLLPQDPASTFQGNEYHVRFPYPAIMNATTSMANNSNNNNTNNTNNNNNVDNGVISNKDSSKSIISTTTPQHYYPSNGDFNECSIQASSNTNFHNPAFLLSHPTQLNHPSQSTIQSIHASLSNNPLKQPVDPSSSLSLHTPNHAHYAHQSGHHSGNHSGHHSSHHRAHQSQETQGEVRFSSEPLNKFHEVHTVKKSSSLINLIKSWKK